MTTPFQEKVYELCSKIPKGKVSTYGVIAKVLSSSPRAVGQALKCNPYAPKVPCHRVVCSNGRIGGFFGQIKGVEVDRKIELLKNEGVEVKEGTIIDFNRKLAF